MITHKIGLEIHVRLKTKTKLFSVSENNFSHLPNTLISSYDLAFPGLLPQTNNYVVKLALQTCFLLNCKINKILSFDRKNYYYFDLPKGYQITQFYNPLGKNGTIKIFQNNNQFKEIRICSVIIEEDTAKSIHKDQKVFIDYNRCGTPLLEIVTMPDFENGLQVEIFLKKMIRLLKRNNISDSDFSLGFIRCDVNISTSIDQKGDCKITEIKNLNSLKSIKNAILLEMKNQINNYHDHQSTTKKYDQKTKTLQVLRRKFSRFDYFFIPENNLAPFILKEEIQEKYFQEVKEKKDFEIKYIQKYHLLFQESEWIFEHHYLLTYLQKLNSFSFSKKIIFFLLKEIVHSWHQKNINCDHFVFEDQLFFELVLLLKKNKISLGETKTLFYNFQNSQNFSQKITSYLKQKKSNDQIIFSSIKIKQILTKLLQNDLSLKEKLLTKNDSTKRYIIGQILKETQGKAEINKIIKIINDFIIVSK